jgi:hypothetical protein
LCGTFFTNTFYLENIHKEEMYKMDLPKSYKKFLASTVSTIMVSSISVPFSVNYVSAQQINFSDVKTDDYFYEAVQSLAARNIIQGYQDGTFKPYESVTRAQAAKMLALALGLDVKNVTDPGFKDVSKTDWFYGPVAVLVKEGILKGYDDKTFKPYEKITRAQMAKIISLGFKLKENKNDKLPFVDVKSGDWFAGFVGALYENGITTGKTKNEFAPNEPVKRGQMAAFIYRAENLKSLTKTAKIEKVTSNSIILNGEQYQIVDEIKNILNEVNAEVLINANVVVETKGKQVTGIKYLEITSSGTNENLVLDGQQGTIDGDVKISADNITLKNLTINRNLEIGKELKNKFYASNVEVKGKTVISNNDINSQTVGSNLFYKSLTYKLPLTKIQTAQEVKTNITFENSILGLVELNKQGSSFEVKGTTNVKEIVATSNVSIEASSDVQISKLVLSNGVTNIKLNAAVNEMVIQATGDLLIEGNGSVKKINVQSATNMVLNTTGKIEQLEIENEKSQITLQANVRVGNVLVPADLNVSSIIKNYDSVKTQIEKVNGNLINNGTSSGGTTGGSGGSGSSGSTNNGSNNNNSQIPSVISQAGTYGPSSGQLTINGNVTINSSNVTLKNVKITGNLILGEGIGEGEVTLEGVTVEGKTEVRGGGENSIHFKDSVLMTVIVNKNDGRVRIVAQGSTRVVDLQLESFAKVEEMNLTGDAPGFTNVTLVESIQSSNPNLTVSLVGNFETINSRAANVKIELAEETNIETLVLNAIAAVTGAGQIRTAEINAEGITLSQEPRNLVLQIPNGSVRIGDREVTESYSDVAKTTIKGIKATQGVIDVELQDYVADLTMDDFKVTAKLEGEDVTLQNLNYDPNKKRITYAPIPLTTENLEKEVEITVAPADGTEKLEGEPQTTKVELNTGFEGYITDIYGVGVEGLTIKFRRGSNAREGEVVKEVTTDKYGYYSVSLEPGTYTGEISGNGFVTSYMLAVAPDDRYNVGQNETAIRAAATSEVKIMLTWNQNPRDVDSHLVGPAPDGSGLFHTWYSDKEYEYNGITYVDLDWDDVDSYGPETTTIRKLIDGTYKFIVHNYSGEYDDDVSLRQSGAKVQIFKGNSTSPDKVFEIPAGEGDELYWTVFEMVVSDNGRNIEIKEINTLSKERPEDLPSDSEPPVDLRTELEWVLEEARSQLVVLREHYDEEELQPLTEAISSAETALTSEETSEEMLQQILTQLRGALEQFDYPTAPAAVTGVNVTTTDTDTVNSGGVENTITWTDSEDTDVVSYRIIRAEADDINDATAIEIANDIAPGTETYTDTTATPGKTYYYFVVAVDGAGNEGVPTNGTSVATATDQSDATAPAADETTPFAWITNGTAGDNELADGDVFQVKFSEPMTDPTTAIKDAVVTALQTINAEVTAADVTVVDSGDGKTFNVKYDSSVVGGSGTGALDINGGVDITISAGAVSDANGVASDAQIVFVLKDDGPVADAVTPFSIDGTGGTPSDNTLVSTETVTLKFSVIIENTNNEAETAILNALKGTAFEDKVASVAAKSGTGTDDIEFVITLNDTVDISTNNTITIPTGSIQAADENTNVNDQNISFVITD